jgi:hypothetical protein
MRLRLYTVHLAPGAPIAEAVLVKEGFCWPALIFGPFWALWHGLWLWAALWLCAGAGFAGIEALWPGAHGVIVILELALAVLIAAEGNDLRRRRLERLGLQEIGVVGGAGEDSAVRRFADLAAIGAR